MSFPLIYKFQKCAKNRKFVPLYKKIWRFVFLIHFLAFLEHIQVELLPKTLYKYFFIMRVTLVSLDIEFTLYKEELIKL
jgi:hypothetical protein